MKVIVALIENTRNRGEGLKGLRSAKQKFATVPFVYNDHADKQCAADIGCRKSNIILTFWLASQQGFYIKIQVKQSIQLGQANILKNVYPLLATALPMSAMKLWFDDVVL